MDIQTKRYSNLLSLLNNRERRVLDIGCQRGELCYLLSEKGIEPYGIDIDCKLIESARQAYPFIKFECCDCGEKIPYDDEFFDVVWAGDIIEHICNTDIFINEVNRVLKKDGIFVLSTPTHNKLKNIIICLTRFEKHFNPEFPHYRFYTVKSIKSVLEKRGFKVKKIKYMGRFWPFSRNMTVLADKIVYNPVFSKYRY